MRASAGDEAPTDLQDVGGIVAPSADPAPHGPDLADGGGVAT